MSAPESNSISTNPSSDFSRVVSREDVNTFPGTPTLLHRSGHFLIPTQNVVRYPPQNILTPPDDIVLSQYTPPINSIPRHISPSFRLSTISGSESSAELSSVSSSPTISPQSTQSIIPPSLRRESFEEYLNSSSSHIVSPRFVAPSLRHEFSRDRSIMNSSPTVTHRFVQDTTIPSLHHGSSRGYIRTSPSPNTSSPSVQGSMDISPRLVPELTRPSSSLSNTPSHISTNHEGANNTSMQTTTRSTDNFTFLFPELVNLDSEMAILEEGKATSEQNYGRALDSFSIIFRDLVDVGNKIHSMDPSGMSNIRSQVFTIIDTGTAGLVDNLFHGWAECLRQTRRRFEYNLHREAITCCDVVIAKSRLFIQSGKEDPIQLIIGIYINLIATYLRWIIFSTQGGLNTGDRQTIVFGMEAFSLLKELHANPIVLGAVIWRRNSNTSESYLKTTEILSAISVLHREIQSAVGWNPTVLEMIQEISMMPYQGGSINAKFILDYDIRSDLRIESDSDFVICVARISDTTIVAGLMDGTLEVWEIQNLRRLWVLTGHQNCVQCVARISENTIISGSNDATLKIWDLTNGSCILTIRGHTDSVMCVTCISSTLIVSGSEDKTLRVWEVSSTGFRCLHILTGHTYDVLCVASVSDNLILSTSRDMTLRMWKIDNGEVSRTVFQTRNLVKSLAVISSDLFATGFIDGGLSIWKVGSENPVRSLKGHTRNVSGVTQIAEDLLVSSSWDGTLRVWKISTGECVQVLNPRSKDARCVACVSDHLFVGGFEDGTLQLWRF